MRTRVVRAAIAPISTIASSRGLAKIESPTHTESQPDDSASAASCSISATVVAPMTTPRLGRVSPNFTLPPAISFLLPRPENQIPVLAPPIGERRHGPPPDRPALHRV